MEIGILHIFARFIVILSSLSDQSTNFQPNITHLFILYQTMAIVVAS